MSRTMNPTYDERCRKEFESLLMRVEHLFVNIDIGCPYGLPYVSTFHQATFGPLSERAMELFLAAGYRRNGNCLYNMSCMACSDCIPIRLHPSEFRPNRNQRRVWAKNKDVKTALVPLTMVEEDLALCEKFLRVRYPRENNSAQGYYRDFFLNNIVNTVQLQYRIEDRLVGGSIIDLGYNWMNAVYFYFDPEESSRSLGTYNILCLVDLCREWEIEFLYLGYYIRTVPAMSYKANFHPHYLFSGKEWYPGWNRGKPGNGYPMGDF